MPTNTTARLKFEAMAANQRLRLHTQAMDSAESLRHLLEPLVSQGHSLRYIAEFLNRSGVETATGVPWSAKTVSRVICRLALRDSRAA